MATIVSGNPIINSTQTLVDDRNPLISYTGGPWELGGTPGFEYNGTTHGVLNPATVRLSFQGTSIAAYGTLGTSTPSCQIAYTIDGVTMSSGPQPTVNLPAGNPMYGAQLFVSPQLTAATHTFTITIGPCTNSAEAYWLDYFVFQPATVTKGSSTSTTWSSTSATATYVSSTFA